jgi:mediator of RNA polymerase II transcription subunit 14
MTMKFAVDCMHGLRIHLCADEVVIVTVDSRTGRLNLRDVGDLPICCDI